MNLFSLLDQLSAVDASPDAAPRRQLLRQLGRAGARAAVAALPMALALPAHATPTDTSLDGIRILLQLEDLLVAFYTQALAAPALTASIPTAQRPDFERLLIQQQNHAGFWRSVLSAAGITPPPVRPASGYDFSGRRSNLANPELFPGVMTNYDAFLQLAQQLEDASASIYLGQISAFTNDKQLLEATLRLQIVKARHASHVRTLRRTTAAVASAVKSWPSKVDPAPSPAIVVPSPAGGTAAPVSIYSFEAKETQVVSGTNEVPFLGVLTGPTAVQYSALSEAFDEPLPTRQATALLEIFG
ncbi:ferritin-like domain-containing protein [Hymenobacter sp. BT664]|uniref:Ferritin-like domain-containing protein n=1 Tax=Hymenobacter montanus TaxID=2771359 RepID=A0A927BAD1_9BACT|nr:ferritin-like domain-containing protein [Hymenobacter montanus]MBD2767090.1 ferritin-like domain-containing protein [Hymenobacter montanus]